MYRLASRFAFWWGMLILLIAFAVLYPDFFAHFATHVPAGFARFPEFRGPFFGGDHLQLVYLGWKLKQAVVTGEFPVYVDGYNFVIRDQPFIDMHLGVQFILQAIANLFVGEVCAYNAIVVVGSILGTFASTYFMASQITSSALMRVAAGIGLACLPYRVSQTVMGHGGGLVFAFLPLYFGSIIKHRIGRSEFRWDGVAGLALFFTVLSDEHQGYYLLLASAMLFICFWGNDYLKSRLTWKSGMDLVCRWPWLLLSLVAVIAFGLGMNKLLSSETGGANLVRSAEEISSYSLTLPQFLKRGFNIGSLWIAALLTSLILGARFGRSSNKLSLRVWPFAVPLIVFSCLMTGIGSHWSQQSGVYEWFSKYVPFFSYQRVPAKMSVVVAVLLVITSLIAIDRLRPNDRSIAMSAGSKLKWGFSFVLILFIAQPIAFLDFAKTHRKYLILDDLSSGFPKLFKFMRENIGPSEKLFILPASDRMDRFAGLAQYLALRTERHFVNGYHGTAPMKVMDALLRMSSFSDSSPSGAAIRWLRDEGVTHVVVSDDPGPELFQENFRNRLEQSGLFEQLICDQSLCLYAVVQEKLVPELFVTFGRTGPQTFQNVAGRWMIEDSITMPAGMDEEKVSAFSVKTLIQVSDDRCQSGCKVEMRFGGGRDEELWLLQAGTEPQKLLLEQNNEEAPNVLLPAQFFVKASEFLIAVRQGWRPVDFGIHVSGRYGHFFAEPKIVQ